MSYTIQSSEKLRKLGADMETKALLYLMNFRDDSNEIYYFIVDFFNDLTGMNKSSSKLWDLQSKASTNNSPKIIGRELVTLFKNFISSLKFDSYILFIGGVSKTFRKDNTQNVFDINNVTENALRSLIEGLKNEATKKTYIDNTLLNSKVINEFLNNIVFVIDDKKPSEYVKAIIKNHPNIIPEDRILDAIFNEIRDKQSDKKNISIVEGITIETSDEALNYYRHLSTNEIKLLTLQRIISRDPVGNGVPISFMPIQKQCPPERLSDVLDDCKQTLCRALFNKNAAESFWSIFECVYTLIVNNPKDDVQNIYNKVGSGLIEQSPDFDTLSIKYFIAIVKDGIQR